MRFAEFEVPGGLGRASQGCRYARRAEQAARLARSLHSFAESRGGGLDPLRWELLEQGRFWALERDRMATAHPVHASRQGADSEFPLRAVWADVLDPGPEPAPALGPALGCGPGHYGEGPGSEPDEAACPEFFSNATISAEAARLARLIGASTNGLPPTSPRRQEPHPVGPRRLGGRKLDEPRVQDHMRSQELALAARAAIEREHMLRKLRSALGGSFWAAVTRNFKLDAGRRKPRLERVHQALVRCASVEFDPWLAQCVLDAKAACRAQHQRLGAGGDRSGGLPPQQASASGAAIPRPLRSHLDAVLRDVAQARSNLAKLRAALCGAVPPAQEGSSARRADAARVDALAKMYVEALEEEDGQYHTVVVETQQGLSFARWKDDTAAAITSGPPAQLAAVMSMRSQGGPCTGA